MDKQLFVLGLEILIGVVGVWRCRTDFGWSWPKIIKHAIKYAICGCFIAALYFLIRKYG